MNIATIDGRFPGAPRLDQPFVPFDVARAVAPGCARRPEAADARGAEAQAPRGNRSAPGGPRERKADLIALLPALRAYALSLSGRPDRADDLVQDTIVNAWESFASFTPGTNLRAWLFTILRNQFYSDCRKRRREVEDADGTYAEGLKALPEQDGCLDLKDLRRALRRLAPDQREALMLIGGSGMSYEEAAALCGCAIGTMKSRVNRARRRLSQALAVTSGAEFGPDARFI